MEKKIFGFLLLLVLIALASQDEKILVKVEGRVCESKSHHYKGPCVRDHNCALVCRNEGFSGGNCIGFRRRCFCTRLC